MINAQEARQKTDGSITIVSAKTVLEIEKVINLAASAGESHITFDLLGKGLPVGNIINLLRINNFHVERLAGGGNDIRGVNPRYDYLRINW
jgi:hypothetical protein